MGVPQHPASSLFGARAGHFLPRPHIGRRRTPHVPHPGRVGGLAAAAAPPNSPTERRARLGVGGKGAAAFGNGGDATDRPNRGRQGGLGEGGVEIEGGEERNAQAPRSWSRVARWEMEFPSGGELGRKRGERTTNPRMMRARPAKTLGGGTCEAPPEAEVRDGSTRGAWKLGS